MTDSGVNITEESIEDIVVKLVKFFVDHGIDKPTSGVAMLFLVERLKAEGYQFTMIPMQISDDIH